MAQDNRQPASASASSTPQIVPPARPPTPTATIVGAVVQLIARFRQPAVRDTEKRGTNVIAHCDISGCFTAALPHLTVLDFALALNRDREMIVYMPGYGSSKAVGLPQLAYTGGKMHKNGRDVTPKTLDDARYLDEMTALQDAIVDAWARANADKTKQPWGRDFALKIAAPTVAEVAQSA